MKVLILGGYGVFGERLARLLVRDGHEVCVAGRNLQAAEKLASDIKCSARELDRGGSLEGLSEFDAVVDAAGPFHTYGDNPYHVARRAIEAGVHYLDLCDDTEFCAGMTVLDADAKKAGVCVLSGLSSVPALSSAAVTKLAGEDRPEYIETAILPGNKSPRGISVMHSILAQAGQPFEVWRAGRWTKSFSWSDPKTYALPKGIDRQGWQIAVPDHRLFPEHFKADTVIFRAGLELAIMRYGLAAFALLRRLVPFPVKLSLVKAFKRVADALEPFGTGDGGMVVKVITKGEERNWRLLAEEGDGPFIPTISIRALLRRVHLPMGAGPALSVVTLAEAEAAMEGLKTTTQVDVVPCRPAFQDCLGAEFDHLPAAVQRAHQTTSVHRWSGHASITRGAGLWPNLIAIVFRFPAEFTKTEVEVTKIATKGGEIWERRFGQHHLKSRLRQTRDGMTEKFGKLTFLLGLTVENGALHFPVTSARLGIIPLPKWLLPLSKAREFELDGQFHFDIAVYAPLTHQLIVHYQGNLEPVLE